MPPTGPDASNSCLPLTSPVVVSVPPVPSCQRGERCPFTGDVGRQHRSKPVLVYGSGRLVVARTIAPPPREDGSGGVPPPPPPPPLLPDHSPLSVLVYRGHASPVTAVSVASSGAYCATGDERGTLRVWALDHPEHLCKFQATVLSGPVRDASWDGESRRIAVAGERTGSDASGDCARALQWDTGVTVGQLSQHLKGRCASVCFRPGRPLRIVTAGRDDHKCQFHGGPPFQRVPPANGVPTETAHVRGAVNCVRYNAAGTLACSVGSDRSVCIYDGATFELKHRREDAHRATIYGCAWSSSDDSRILTSSGDGTCKLFAVTEATGELEEVRTWNVAEHQAGKTLEKVPVGAAQLGCAFVQGTRPVSVGYNGQISVLPVAEGGAIETITGHYAPVAALAVDAANGAFYTGDTDGILCRWDLETCQPVKRLEPPEGNDADLMHVVHTGAIAGLACCCTTGSSGSLLSVGWDDKLFVTSKDGTVGDAPTALGAQPVAISTGSSVAVIATVQGLLVRASDGSMGDMVPIPYEASAVAVSKDDKLAYVGGKDCKIYVYSVSGTSLKEIHVIENGHLKPVHALALSNGGAKLASADERDVCVFDLQGDYAPLIARGRWCFHVQRVTCLSWSPDDRVIASGGADDSIYLWSPAAKMKRVHYPYAHRGGVTGLQFLPNSSKDGLKLLSVGVDSVVNLWDVTKDVKEKFG